VNVQPERSCRSIFPVPEKSRSAPDRSSSQLTWRATLAALAMHHLNLVAHAFRGESVAHAAKRRAKRRIYLTQPNSPNRRLDACAPLDPFVEPSLTTTTGCAPPTATPPRHCRPGTGESMATPPSQAPHLPNTVKQPEP
jgi:hypothetical protein